ncbi:hypothetical protein BT63DRAFT_483357 [Microthyrium microscopicum]|uniref:Mid2 domain-containing protein n=1 Tax=Microthyrium microscopicum TaxID=703497 RepID=A0A6A6TY86_9PEZI|nr:hypothetical protein BT63DRAFT_483357 [Microthyrium microscopicum]
MISRFSYALSLLTLAQRGASIAFPGPEPTIVARNFAVQDSVSPKPTEAPDHSRNPLVKRSYASADTCGWIWDASASESSVLSCQIGSCAIYTASLYIQGCCYGGYTNCEFASKCYDRSQYNGNQCGSSCLSNTLNLVCSAAAEPYCQTYTYPGKGVTGYGCGIDAKSQMTPVTSTIRNTLYTGYSYITAYVSTAPYYAVTSRSSSSGKYTTSLYSGGSNSYDYSSSTTSTAVLLIPLIIIFVALGIGYISSIVIVILCCRRHRRNLRAIDQQNAMRAGIQPVGITNVAPLNYFPAGGAQAEYFASKGNMGSSPVQVNPYAAPMETSTPMGATWPAQTYSQAQAGQTTYTGTREAISPESTGQTGLLGHNYSTTQLSELSGTPAPGQAYLATPPLVSPDVTGQTHSEPAPGQAYSPPQALPYQPPHQVASSGRGPASNVHEMG